jgi:hypothetical protein
MGEEEGVMEGWVCEGLVWGIDDVEAVVVTWAL